MDNLEAQTYETFEKDTIKYIQVWSSLLSIIATKLKLNLVRGLLVVAIG